MHGSVCAIRVAAGLAAAPAGAPQTAAEPATLTVANRFIVKFRGSIHGNDPAERVRLAAERVGALSHQDAEQPVSTQPVTIGTERGLMVLVGNRLVFLLTEGDVEPLAGEALDQLARAVVERLTGALQAEREQRSVPRLLRAVAESLAATVALVAVLWVLVRLRRVFLKASKAIAERRTAGLARRGIDLTPLLQGAIRVLSFVAFWAVVAVFVDVWITFVLGRFPLTAPWADALTGGALGILTTLGLAVLSSIPGLVTVAVIMTAARFLAHFLGGIFDRLESGALKIRGLYPETVPATRRIVSALVWLSALATSYPYIPGASSEAVKGLSLLVGLMFSLGSTGLVSQAMSGLAVIYSRSLAVGDTVRLGETEGVVSEVGLLSTKIVTLRGEEVTVPNTVVIGGAVRNFTRLSGGSGPLVTTQVTIGFDAPWRQVQQLLLGAARETRGLKAEPPPFVLQRSLSDFYVVYDLVARLEADPVDRPQVLSELHAHIQDAFNAAGVQIMSPHFVLQPDEPVVVPRERWEGKGAPSPPEGRRG